MDDLHGGGFTCDGENVVGSVVLREMFGAVLGGFLTHEGDEVDGDGEVGKEVFVFGEAREHGGHGAFGIGCASPPDFAVADFSGEGGDGHVGNAYGIEMRAEQDARSAVERGETGDKVWSTGGDFLKGDGGTDVGEPVGEVGGHFVLMGVFRFIRVGVVGIDGGDTDEVLEEHGRSLSSNF